MFDKLNPNFKLFCLVTLAATPFALVKSETQAKPVPVPSRGDLKQIHDEFEIDEFGNPGPSQHCVLHIRNPRVCRPIKWRNRGLNFCANHPECIDVRVTGNCHPRRHILVPCPTPSPGPIGSPGGSEPGSGDVSPPAPSPGPM